MNDWTDFQKYLIGRIDKIEDKISTHKSDITRNTVIITLFLSISIAVIGVMAKI